jgi:hypothetical protein
MHYYTKEKYFNYTLFWLDRCLSIIGFVAGLKYRNSPFTFPGCRTDVFSLTKYYKRDPCPTELPA